MTLHNSLDHFRDEIMNGLIENEDFYPQRVAGRWHDAKAPSRTPLAVDYMAEGLAPIIEELRLKWAAITTEAKGHIEPHQTVFTAVQERCGYCPSELISEEAEYFDTHVRNLPLTSYARARGVLHPRQTCDLLTVDYIHGALFTTALDLCDELAKTKSFLVQLIKDPLGYFDDLHNRRWDAANGAFAECDQVGDLVSAAPWRQNADTWTREFKAQKAGESVFGMASVRFRPLRCSPEAINTSMTTPTADHPRDTEIEPL